LHRSDVIAAFEQMRGKGMAEGMVVRCGGRCTPHNQYVWIADTPLSLIGKRIVWWGLILSCNGFLCKLLQETDKVKYIRLCEKKGGGTALLLLLNLHALVKNFVPLVLRVFQSVKIRIQDGESIFKKRQALMNIDE
ncbi:MAG: hypothetical protein ACE5GF_09265, partial [Thermodesulfobacteriota bacterium]